MIRKNTLAHTWDCEYHNSNLKFPLDFLLLRILPLVLHAAIFSQTIRFSEEKKLFGVSFNHNNGCHKNVCIKLKSYNFFSCSLFSSHLRGTRAMLTKNLLKITLPLAQTQWVYLRHLGELFIKMFSFHLFVQRGKNGISSEEADVGLIKIIGSYIANSDWHHFHLDSSATVLAVHISLYSTVITGAKMAKQAWMVFNMQMQKMPEIMTNLIMSLFDRYDGKNNKLSRVISFVRLFVCHHILFSLRIEMKSKVSNPYWHTLIKAYE